MIALAFYQGAQTPAEIHVSSQTRLLAAALAVIITLVVLELVRRHKLQTRYTVLWLGSSAVLALLAIFPELLGALARVAGVTDTTAAFLAAGLVIGATLVLNLTAVVSQQSEQITRLAQEMAIQRAEIERLSGDAESDEG